jgi:hypothetical protein
MSELRADTITGSDGTSPVTLTKQSAAKGWCTFDGTAGTPTFNDSFNGSSITDNGTGDQAMNLTNAMTNANYPASFLGNARSQFGTPANSHTSSSVCTIRSTNISDANNDNSFVQIVIHGDLA